MRITILNSKQVVPISQKFSDIPDTNMIAITSIKSKDVKDVPSTIVIEYRAMEKFFNDMNNNSNNYASQ